jgi:hypothetical protein
MLFRQIQYTTLSKIEFFKRLSHYEKKGARAMSILLDTVLKQVEQLTAEERLELIQKVAEGLKSKPESTSTKPKWADLRGMAPYPLMGEDAQEWVSRTRRESDDHRAKELGQLEKASRKNFQGLGYGW